MKHECPYFVSHVEQMNEIKAKNVEGSTSNPKVNMIRIEEAQLAREPDKVLVATMSRSMARKEKGKMIWDEKEEVR